MAGNKNTHGKGWPTYGWREPGKAANYTPRKRGPAITPKRLVATPAEVAIAHLQPEIVESDALA
jgi:hypothetical protein